MKIKLNDKTGLDADKLIESRLLIQANSGGGKSMTIRRFIEQAFGPKQIIVLDPEGEFTNLREKFDFVYAGKGGDTPAEPRSAALLAKRLLELGSSAIVDLYELSPQERKRFVRLFLEALVNAPKELWHDCFIILDEAHVFAPEKAEAESLSAVIDLASRGRKRGFCLIPATQRPAKLNKDVAAECNNKLIGRATLDIDRKRAAEELGFTSKEQVLSLRDLEPGEFYVFGPAISRTVEKIKVTEPTIKPPARSAVRKGPPPPTKKVKEILGKLADLPKEAEEEAKTVGELKKKVRELEGQLRHKLPEQNLDIKDFDEWYRIGDRFGHLRKLRTDIMQEAGLQWEKIVGEWRAYAEGLRGQILEIGKTIALWEREKLPRLIPEGWLTPSNFVKVNPKDFKKARFEVKVDVASRPDQTAVLLHEHGEVSEISKGELAVLTAVAQYRHEGLPRESITTITGYKRSTRDAYIARLLGRALVEVNKTDGRIYVTGDGVTALGDNFKPLPVGAELFMHLMNTLPEGERRVLVAIREGNTDREAITGATGYKRSTRDAYIARLVNRQLVVTTREGVALSAMLES